MDADLEVRARIPADVEAPDRIVFNLTARQAAILVAAAAAGYLMVRAFGALLPVPVLILLLTPVAGAAVTLALGRRDGLPLDVWVWAALRYRRAPRHLVAAAVQPPPVWAPDVDGAAGPVRGRGCCGCRRTRSAPAVPLMSAAVRSRWSRRRR